MARIHFSGVGKRYPNGFVALADLNLEIADREFLVLLGPSGCGKSTTLNMIAGLEEITSGELRFDQAVVNDVPPHKRDVAMVFQSYALYPHKSVFENIAFGLRMRGQHDAAEIDRRVRDAARRLEIESLLERRPNQLSGGQRQRVALGRAMVRQPSVFLMDEPLSNLDAALRISMRAEIKQLHHAMQTTFVYVTHDQAEALTLADRIVVMRDGVVQQIGTADQIYEQPDNQFVASFLGNPPINFIEGTVVSSSDGPLFQCGELQLALPASLATKARAQGNRPVVLGLRAEDVLEHAGTPTSTLRGEVTTVLPVGSDQFLGLKTEGGLVYLRVGKDRRHHEGERAELAVVTSRLHLFDKASGESLRG
jgi:multiple sugar transport system ATP-binding protein